MLTKGKVVVDLRSQAEVAPDGGEDAVASFAGFGQVACFEGKSQTFSRGVRLVDCYMAPPYSPVIPQVMVGVVVIDANGYFRLSFHILAVNSHLLIAGLLGRIGLGVVEIVSVYCFLVVKRSDALFLFFFKRFLIKS